MTYQEVLDYLYSSLPMFQRVGPAALKPGLDNTLRLLSSLGNPENKFKSIHIAGTNGKGSSSHMLAAILQSSGYKTGLYTSPHLKNFTERIKINGKEVQEEFIIRFIEKYQKIIEDIKPSFFEVTVAMAFQYFTEEKIDIAVIETGLGGRLDSTNVISPIVSLITNISYDHQNILGDTLEKIAYEKAGIIKNETPIVISESQSASISQIFIDKAIEQNAPIVFADQQYTIHQKIKPSGIRLDAYSKKTLDYYDLDLDLSGKYQLKNIAGVLAVTEILHHQGLHIEEENLREGLRNTVALTDLKGRWQRLSEHPLIICDTGHNISGIQQIVEQISSINYRQLFWVFGTVNDKDPVPVLSILPNSAYYIFCQASIPRALEADLLYSKASEFGLKGHVEKNVNLALQWAKKNAAPEDLILVGGSTFVVAEIEGL